MNFSSTTISHKPEFDTAFHLELTDFHGIEVDDDPFLSEIAHYQDFLGCRTVILF